MSTQTAPLLLRAPLKAADRHFSDRFSYGHNPTLEASVRAAGGGRAWFEKQLTPGAIKDPQGDKPRAWYPHLSDSPAKIFYNSFHQIYGGWQVMEDLARWTVMRRIMSNHQLHEMMVEFWSNLLHIAIGDDQAYPWRVTYDSLMRKHALGRFDDMLVAAITHPAMGLWLDNNTSTKDAPNENLGRELLELHSVGVEAGYTQADVEKSAKMLTGWRVDLYREGDPGVYDQVWEGYDTSWHYVGKLSIFGQSFANSTKDGRQASKDYIRYLAHHPATAKRIAKRLAVRFVNDDPSADLVRTIKHAWIHSGTDIKATLRAMVGHPEFAKSASAKVRTPLEDVLATARALQYVPRSPRDPDSDFAITCLWTVDGMGMRPYYWPAPNGHPETNPPWSSAGRALDSFGMHRSLAAWGPPGRVSAPSTQSWLPALPAKFSDVVNHVAQRLLGVSASDRMKSAVALRSGIPMTRSVTADDMNDSVVQQLLTTLLGSPTHMTR